MSTARAYYNEFDPYAAAWLRNLIAAGHIAPGDVDERSIEDVRPDDLRGYTQCHFFAGIGVWSLALRRAGWSDDREIWTGSCPCQPFSAAGKGAGFADERHLWPAFHWLIEQCRPAVVAGEQVASKDGLGWLDLVQADLEGTGYASRAVDLCAAGVGAPHIRQRLWWIGERMADADRNEPRAGRDAGSTQGEGLRLEPGRRSYAGRLGDDAGLEGQRNGHQAASGRNGAVRPVAEAGEFGGMADADGRNTSAERQQRSGGQRQQPEDGRSSDLAEWASVIEQNAIRMAKPDSSEREARELQPIGNAARPERASQPGLSVDTGPTNGHWRDADWLFCRDGKWRPVEPGTFPLAHGAPARVGRLRAYGNAIVADAAQAFIKAYLDTLDERFRLTRVSLLSGAEDVFS